MLLQLMLNYSSVMNIFLKFTHKRTAGQTVKFDSILMSMKASWKSSFNISANVFIFPFRFPTPLMEKQKESGFAILTL